MKQTSRSSRARGAHSLVTSVALLGLACGGRSGLESFADQLGSLAASGATSSLPTQGGAANTGGHGSSTGGIIAATSTSPSGGAAVASRTASTTGSQTTAGGTTHSGGASSTGGTTRSSGVTASGGNSSGGAPHTFTSSAGTTSTSTLGGRTATGGTRALGSTSGGTTVNTSGGTNAAGGITATGTTSACSMGLTDCDAGAGVACVDLKTNTANCGACGHACKSGWHCFTGQCRAPACNRNLRLGPTTLFVNSNAAVTLSALVSADFNRDGVLDLAASDLFGNAVDVLLGEGQGNFGQTVTYPTAPLPVALATADLNRDGNPDLVSVNYSDNLGVSVLWGNGDGTFAPKLDTATSSGVDYLAIGDLNGDGIPDLVTDGNVAPATPDGGNGAPVLQVLIGKGNGTFAEPVQYPTNSALLSLALVDVNGDAQVDVVAVTWQVGAVGVWLGNGDGTLGQEQDVSVGGNPNALAVADLNVDGRVDLVVSDADSPQFYVLLGDGRGGFTRSGTYATTGTVSLAIGDVNRDGVPDVITTSDDPRTFLGDVSVYLGRGDGTFTVQGQNTVDVEPVAPNIGDFDGDGLLDVATASYTDGTLTLQFGNGSGTFEGTARYPRSNCPYTLALADLNLDGMVDLITGNSYGSIDVNFGPILDWSNPSAHYDLNVNPAQVVVGDVDGDDQPDLVTHAYEGDTIVVLFGMGGGQFGNRVDIPCPGVRRVKIADVDNDGLNDIVSVNQNPAADPDTLVAIVNLGYRTFGAPSLIMSNDAADFALGDLNGDHLNDLVIGANSLQVALGKGAGSFAEPVEIDAGYDIEAVSLVDLNADGNLDIVADSYGSSWAKVYLGQGQGSFDSGQTYPGGGGRSLVVNDINGDGRWDIVAATNSATFSLLLGSGSGTFANPVSSGYAWVDWVDAMASGDINGDGWPDLVTVGSSNCELDVLYGKCR